MKDSGSVLLKSPQVCEYVRFFVVLFCSSSLFFPHLLYKYVCFMTVTPLTNNELERQGASENNKIKTSYE